MTTRHPDDLDRGRAGNDGADHVVRHEERLVAGTERHTVGRVTMRKVVVEEQHTITVTLRREDVEVVEELEGAAPAAPEGAAPRSEAARDEHAGRDERLASRVDSDTGELVLYAERPIVTTEWVPVERVRLDRTTTQGVETVTAEVAREVVTMEDERSTAGDDVR